MKILQRAGTVVLSVILWAIILVAALYAFTTIASLVTIPLLMFVAERIL